MEVINWDSMRINACPRGAGGSVMVEKLPPGKLPNEGGLLRGF
jgi:hypothetical protein